MTDHGDDRVPTATVLADAARAAGYAPSIHNSQPWRWRVAGDRLELFAVRQRQLGVTDPLGRLLQISCGAALHHARLALAAQRWQAEVHRRPDSADPDLLARLVLTGLAPGQPATPPTAPGPPSAVALVEALPRRHTDRRPVPDIPVEPSALAEVGRAVATEGARLHLLPRDDLLLLASAADEAQQVELADPQWRAELAYWSGGDRTEGLGVPATAIPDQAPQTTVPGRDFGQPGTLPISTGHDRAASYAILYGDEDTPLGWLRGGEALSAGWLTATVLGLSVLPLSAAVEVDRTRSVLAGLLAHLGYPFLVLRLGVIVQQPAGAAPRLPTEQIIEVGGEAERRHPA
jgi:nitroreductase